MLNYIVACRFSAKGNAIAKQRHQLYSRLEQTRKSEINETNILFHDTHAFQRVTDCVTFSIQKLYEEDVDEIIAGMQSVFL